MKKTIANDKILLKQIEGLLSDQTGVILSVMDEKIGELERKVDGSDIKLDRLDVSPN